MTKKGYSRKWSWPNLRYHLGNCLDGLSKTTKTVRIAGLRAGVRTLNFPNEKQECYLLGHDIRFVIVVLRKLVALTLTIMDLKRCQP
jgi:hypothetical protein